MRMRGFYGDASACCCTRDFGVSLFHRPRRHQRPAASALNRLPDDSFLSVQQFVKPSLLATDSAQTSAGILLGFCAPGYRE